jgi:hypothetical protein
MTVATTSTRASNRTAKNADDLLRRYATQLTSALGLVVCITGVMMFYRWHKGEVEAMHEWLGMGFVVAAVLHGLRHRQSLTLMLSQYRTRLLLLGTALITVGFLVVPPQKTTSPVKQTVGAVLRAPLGDIAPVFGLSAKDAVERLADAGVLNASATKSIEAMARANHTAPMKLLNAILEQADRD